MNIVEKIDSKFASGNSVDIDSIRLKAEEWAELKAELNKQKSHIIALSKVLKKKDSVNQ